MKVQKALSQRMLRGPLLPSILLYTIPIILTSLLQLLFNAADLVVVGRWCGSVAVAAVGATGSITNLIVNLFIGLSVGSGVTMAHALGGRNEDAAQKTVHTTLPIALISGLFLTVIGVIFSETFLRLMGTPDDVLPLSAKYMRIYFCGITFTMVYNFCASILRAAGDTKSPLIFLTLAGIINVVMNVLFITKLGMDVDGVALATVISQGVAAILVVIAMMRRTDESRLELKKLRIYKVQLLKIIRIGLPAGLQSSMFSISNVIIQSSVNSFGSVVMSGNAAAGNIEGFVYATMNAFQQTAVNFTGQNLGAHRYDRIRKILWWCLGSVTVVGLVLGLTVYGFGPKLLSIYITDSPEAIQYGMLRLAYMCIPYFLCGTMDVSSGALRGLGSSFAPMVISVLGVCGMRIGWIYTIFQLPQFHSVDILFLSYPISWAITYAAQLFAFLYLFGRYRKAHAAEEIRE